MTVAVGQKHDGLYTLPQKVMDVPKVDTHHSTENENSARASHTANITSSSESFISNKQTCNLSYLDVLYARLGHSSFFKDATYYTL